MRIRRVDVETAGREALRLLRVELVAEPESRLAEYLVEACALFADPPPPASPPVPLVVDDDFETLRWFPLPSEILVR